MGIIRQMREENKMSRIIEYDELITLLNKELLDLTKDRGVFLYMHDGSMNEVRIKDLIGSDAFTAKFIDYTGLSYCCQAIKRIEIM